MTGQSEMLTEQQLVELTGYTKASAQIRQLKLQGIHYHLRGDGKPVVTWTAVNYPFINRKAANDNTPKFEAIG
ncbi:DUF4224 domain-containing protein [Shewanella sp. KCT]|uniref:DUF4224 domain-containing protein n=1 Tax=Shewanella sp. KCT TaxID=2569535 RepID=UPI0011821F58|nr:DUF4224 domain-containing protein [Shewanella sp. KCT]TVP11756.1 hypothetical protein AYI87_15100 [Shewanella sp. KCT]